MHSKLFLSSTLVALSTAQFQNINPDAAQRAGNDVANYYSSLATNLAFGSDLIAIASAIPSSVAANPSLLASQLNNPTSAPPWASAIPTSVANSLASILAAPIKAADDVDAIVTASAASAVFVNSALPTSVQIALQTGDPLDVVGDVLTASTVPSWVSAVPASVQSAIGSIANAELSTIIADYEGAAKPTGTFVSSSFRTASGPVVGATTCPACPSCPLPVTIVSTVTAVAGFSSSSAPSRAPLSTKPTIGTNPVRSVGASSGLPKPSGSGGLGTKSTGAPIAFTGAAAPMRTAAVGAAALFAGAGALLNV